LLLLGQALSNLQILPSYKTAYITLTNEEKKRFDFKKGDTEGIVNYALSLKGIIFAAIFIEDSEQNIIKISFRSKGNFSVNKFSRNHFEGGGHDNAAGGKSNVSMSKTVTKFTSLLAEYQKELLAAYED
jgi:phosphoesterase RecJ-like protein